ncbi:MAG: hypothetical protein JWP37_3778 [Mucilaginibacter sp.]|nr:hypothetical protein [Mucilaginibacter sp.]
MEIYEFKSLKESKQIEITQRGVFLASRTDSGNHISLYNLDGFYVEVYYSIDLERVVMIRAFDSTDPLERYLDGEEFKGLI